MDLGALNLRSGGEIWGFGSPWSAGAARWKDVMIAVAWPTSSSPCWKKGRRLCGCRFLEFRANGRRKKNNRESDSSSENNDTPIPDGGDSEDIYLPYNKYEHQESHSTSIDWRSFRANLVIQEQMLNADFDSGSHPVVLGTKWAHPIAMPETGCTLVATEKLDGVRNFERSVIHLLRLGTADPREGPFGVIINRPLHKKIKHMKLTSTELANTFTNCPLYFGGPLDTNMFLIRNDGCPPHPNFEQVVPGICFGARNSLNEAAELVKEGILRPRDFRFFVGYAGWQLHQLMEEIESGYWVVSSCSSSLIGRASPVSSSGLWEEILQLMGGHYSELSKKPKQDDS